MFVSFNTWVLLYTMSYYCRYGKCSYIRKKPENTTPDQLDILGLAE
jgi:hypothetical protein